MKMGMKYQSLVLAVYYFGLLSQTNHLEQSHYFPK